MVSLTPNQMISNQAYSLKYRRIIEIEEEMLIDSEKEGLIKKERLREIEEDRKNTYFVNFDLNEHFELLAQVKGYWEQPEVRPLTLKEKNIYYLSDRALFIHGTGRPSAALTLIETLERWEIISKISQRTVVVIDIYIDTKYYKRLNSNSRSFYPSLENGTYILMAPVPVLQTRTIPVQSCEPPSSVESNDSQQSREEEVLDEAPKTPPVIKLHLTQTPESEVDS